MWPQNGHLTPGLLSKILSSYYNAIFSCFVITKCAIIISKRLHLTHLCGDVARQKINNLRNYASKWVPTLIWIEIFSGLSLAGSIAPDQKRQSFMNSKNPSTESQQLLTPPNELQSGEVSPIRRKMGGSYSRYTGAAPLHRGLTIELEGDLVDSSGRKINTNSVGNGNGDLSRPPSVGPPALTMKKWTITNS